MILDSAFKDYKVRNLGAQDSKAYACIFCFKLLSTFCLTKPMGSLNIFLNYSIHSKIRIYIEKESKKSVIFENSYERYKYIFLKTHLHCNNCKFLKDYSIRHMLQDITRLYNIQTCSRRQKNTEKLINLSIMNT